MDYEREPDSKVGDSPAEPEASETTDAAATAAQDSDQGATAAEAEVIPAAEAEHESPDSDLGTDADVLDDSFASGPTPPEWPAVDLVPAEDDDATAATVGVTNVAAASEPVDVGDDSDAPVVTDAALAAPAAADAHIRAENVNLNQSGAQSIDATTVTISQGGAGRVNAEKLSVEQGGVGLARVKTLNLGDGASAFAVVADQATVEEGSNAFLVLSRSVSGTGHATVDWRAAMAFGAGLGLVVSILRRRR